MLSPMQVQYLVGLCCLRRNPEAVDITIGNELFDPAAEIDRDVDVTVTCRDGDVQEAIAGFEVKKEASPMDVTKVEQLCAKLNDLPDLKTRSIVSASGYSPAAVRKAAAHNIQLYDFTDWHVEIRKEFPESTLVGSPSDSLLFTCTRMMWLDGVKVAVNPFTTERAALLAAVQENPPVLDEQGKPHTVQKDIDSLFRAVGGHAAAEIGNTPEAQAILLEPHTVPPNEQPDGPFGSILARDVIVPLQDKLFIAVDGKLTQIEAVSISGNLQWSKSRQQATYQVMRRHGGSEVYAGAAIGHTPWEGVLMAALLSPDDSHMFVTLVHLAEKHKNMIRKLKIRANGSSQVTVFDATILRRPNLDTFNNRNV